MANKIRFFSSFAGGTKRKHTENGVLIWQNGMLGDADFDFTDPELRNVRNELSQMSREKTLMQRSMSAHFFQS